METLNCPYCGKELRIYTDWDIGDDNEIHVSCQLVCQKPNHEYNIIFASDEKELDMLDNRESDVDHAYLPCCTVSNFNRRWTEEYSVQQGRFEEAETAEDEIDTVAYRENLLMLDKLKELADRQISFFKDLSFSSNYNLLP